MTLGAAGERGLADTGGGGSGRAGGERGWPDDADYNNRDFRGLEIAARAFARSAAACDYVAWTWIRDVKGAANCFRRDNWNIDALSR